MLWAKVAGNQRSKLALFVYTHQVLHPIDNELTCTWNKKKSFFVHVICDTWEHLWTFILE